MVLECPKDGQRSREPLSSPCLSCGSEVEMFSDEEEAACENCGSEVRNEGI